MTRWASRQRRERFIDTHDTLTGREFQKALDRCVMRVGGLSFFTDDQIEQIAREMARKARWENSFRVKQRRALRAGRDA